MAMSFSQSVDCVLLFSWWHPTTLAQYVISLLGVFCLCVFSEWLAAYTRRATPGAGVCHGSSERMPLFASGALKSAPASARPVLLNACSIALSYMPMLLAMSFNVGVFVSVALGLAVGRVCFSATGDTRSSVELCH